MSGILNGGSGGMTFSTTSRMTSSSRGSSLRLELTRLPCLSHRADVVAICVFHTVDCYRRAGVTWSFVEPVRADFNVGSIAFLYPKLAIGIPSLIFILFNSDEHVFTLFNAAVMALGLNEGAYFSEIVRSIDRG